MDARFVRSIPWAEKGVWLKGDTHVHTKFSDGGVELREVVERAAKNGCQVLAITDHADAELAATSDEYFDELEQARRDHPELILLAGLEWNVPPWQGREHATLLLSPVLPERRILREFQVLFDDWKREGRDPELATQALDWLASQSSSDGDLPVVIYNHPSRKREETRSLAAELATLRAASGVLIGFEGGPGHQDSEEVGDYRGTLKTVDRWDPAAAEVGGAWDSLLAQGLPVWGAVATSDFHHGDPQAADDFWPGEFSETWLYAPDKSAAGALASLRAGSFFGVHGQIAREVQLRVYAAGLEREAIAGEAIIAAPGSELIVTLHLQTPLVDWQGEPNRIDEVELIAANLNESKVIATRTPTIQSAMRVSVLVPEAGIALRARGRRFVVDGPDLLFYTNPIQILTSETRKTTPANRKQGTPVAATPIALQPTSAVQPASPHTGLQSQPPPDHQSRSVPAWIPLGFIIAASLFTSLVDRWQLEVRRRFASRQQRDEPVVRTIPLGWRRYFLALLFGFVFLAVYGSLVPFRPAPMDWPTAVDRFANILQQPVSLASRSDFATNVLLFLPIGFLMTGLTLGARPGDWRRSVGIVLVVVLCAALSLAIEFAQLWVADRTSSQNDVVAETLGALLGGILWLPLGPLLIAWLGKALNASRPRERIEHMLEAYVALIVLYMLMPLDLTLRPAEIYDKYQDGRINLIPLADLAGKPAAWMELAGDMLLFLPLGLLAAIWRWPVWERVRPLSRSLTGGLLMVGAIELAQVAVASRYSSVTDLVTGGLGVLVGWAIAERLVRANASRQPSGTNRGHAAALSLWTVAYALLVAAVLCLPFETWATAPQVRERLLGLVTRPPLAALYWGTELNAVSQMLRKVLLFVPLGGLLLLSVQARWPDAARGSLAIGLGCLGALAWGATIETAQVWLLPHVPDLTDALLGTLGAAVGMVAVQRVLRSQQTVTV
jgi:glycopeptide antibiotics resistance protein